MKIRIVLRPIWIVIVILTSSEIWAQGNCACCTPEYQQFDFWIGDWIVKDTLGNELGGNTVVYLEDSCMLTEHWIGRFGGTGRSTNFFDKTDSSWNQLWIDNRGSVLKLKGAFENDRMVLKSDLIPGKKVAYYYNQISWIPNKDGSVTQIWEVFDEEGNLLQTIFFGIYWRTN